MDQSVEKRTRRDDHSLRSKATTVFEHDSRESSLIEHKVDDFSLPQMKIGRRLERASHLAPIAHAIRLRARRLHCRTTRTIE